MDSFKEVFDVEMNIQKEAVETSIFYSANFLSLSDDNEFSHPIYEECSEEEIFKEPSSTHSTPTHFNFDSLVSTPTNFRRTENLPNSNKRRTLDVYHVPTKKNKYAHQTS
uniref:Ovule protein n=1 Tax=Strongyloides venezuelensis TaxID=75913 RepID=A0A0K0FFP1_STRVS